ncbi:hypothetical protein [Macrococcoides canis]|uniref:hypothetical protein n=1 Tax=Macrococcoides canis TaxID=1855823 RepID=UPI001B8D04A3|nr:hypothetical protein [Macrococcus canis]QUR93892.1 hypothetical protein GOY09_02525 [Macrococcus canis]UTH03153.1 hypothetical protein KFV05_03970 [Macrococcus canis]UTH07584.1 hypothetical protein KFV07_04000 [Macrococcus canis]
MIKLLFKYVLMGIVLLLYGLHFIYLSAQPVEFINPFDYYAQEELPVLESYLFLILFTMIPVIAYFMSRAQLTRRAMAILIIAGLIMLVHSRMSILFMMMLGLMITNMIYKFIGAHARALYISIATLLITVLIIAILIPSLLLYGGEETFLNVNAFQEFIGVYNASHYGEILQLNRELFRSHLWHYIIVLCCVIVPSMLIGRARLTRFKLPAALILLTLGTAIKLMLFSMSFDWTQFIIILSGSLLQGLAIALLLDRNSHVSSSEGTTFMTFIAIVEISATLLFTGWFRSFPPENLNVMMTESLMLTAIVSVIFIVLMTILHAKHTKFKKI